MIFTFIGGPYNQKKQFYYKLTNLRLFYDNINWLLIKHGMIGFWRLRTSDSFLIDLSLALLVAST